MTDIEKQVYAATKSGWLREHILDNINRYGRAMLNGSSGRQARIELCGWTDAETKKRLKVVRRLVKKGVLLGPVPRFAPRPKEPRSRYWWNPKYVRWQKAHERYYERLSLPVKLGPTYKVQAAIFVDLNNRILARQNRLYSASQNVHYKLNHFTQIKSKGERTKYAKTLVPMLARIQSTVTNWDKKPPQPLTPEAMQAKLVMAQLTKKGALT